MGGMRWLALAVVGAWLWLGIPSAATQTTGGESCLTAELPAITQPPTDLRFGITPLAAGSAGASQLEPVPHEREADIGGVTGLRPEGKQLVVRLNRMFQSDGVEGVRRYAEIVDAYAEAGFDSELQVRYHPPPQQEGDMEAWADYVRLAVGILGRRPSVKALSITNEANFPVSPNTSDGSFEGVREAIVVGTVAADQELHRIGRDDVELGFSFAWRYLPNSDRAFWEEIGERATPAFRQALDYVGLQIYPGLVFPPAPRPGVSAGEEVIEPLTLLRDCYLPKAGIGDEVDLWVTENGYATNLGRNEQMQDASTRSTLEAVHDYSGELGITDYRWFNLRDNRTGGPDLFDSVGLMRDDYSPKPAYATFAQLLDRFAADRPRPRLCKGRPVTVLGGPGADELAGTSGTDVIDARGGRDVIEGRGGRDRICSGAGRDRVKGGRGADVVAGGGGADLLSGMGGNDNLRGGAGGDLLRGGAGPDRLWGGGGPDRLQGAGGHDFLNGQAGRDRCRGAGFSDQLRRCES